MPFHAILQHARNVYIFLPSCVRDHQTSHHAPTHLPSRHPARCSPFSHPRRTRSPERRPMRSHCSRHPQLSQHLQRQRHPRRCACSLRRKLHCSISTNQCRVHQLHQLRRLHCRHMYQVDGLTHPEGSLDLVYAGTTMCLGVLHTAISRICVHPDNGEVYSPNIFGNGGQL